MPQCQGADEMEPVGAGHWQQVTITAEWREVTSLHLQI